MECCSGSLIDSSAYCLHTLLRSPSLLYFSLSLSLSLESITHVVVVHIGVFYYNNTTMCTSLFVALCCMMSLSHFRVSSPRKLCMMNYIRLLLDVKIYPGIHVGMVDGTGQLIPTETMRRLYHCYVIPQCMCLEERHACNKHVNMTN